MLAIWYVVVTVGSGVGAGIAGGTCAHDRRDDDYEGGSGAAFVLLSPRV